MYARIRLLSVPLERDEGEYAYMGQLILKGMQPFAHAYTMKPLGVSVLYSVFMMLFGQNPVGIHTGLLIVTLISAGLVYLLAKRFMKRDAALAACASYLLLSVSQSVLGIFAHATHFLTMFVLAGLLVLLQHLQSRKPVLIFSSGLLLGLALTMKQHAVVLIIFAFLYLIWQRRKTGVSLYGKKPYAECVIFTGGVAVPYAAIVISMLMSGEFEKFWFWTIQYAHEYSSGTTLAQEITYLVKQILTIVSAQPLLWLCVGIGLLSVLITRENSEKQRDRVFLPGFFLFSCLAMLPGMVFRDHYFIIILPAASLLAGASFSCGHTLFSFLQFKRWHYTIIPMLFAFAAGYGLFNERAYLFNLSPTEVSRSIYKQNPFPEALHIADYINRNSTVNDKIAVLGSEPEIYFYADRLSATGYIYTYSLMENQPYAELMQSEMIREITASKPRYIVLTRIKTSWMARPESILSIFTWSEDYLKTDYEQVGLIDIVAPDMTRYIWGDEAKNSIPLSESYLAVYKRLSVPGRP